jgi:hypothetical protein
MASHGNSLLICRATPAGRSFGLQSAAQAADYSAEYINEAPQCKGADDETKQCRTIGGRFEIGPDSEWCFRLVMCLVE